MVSPVRLTCRLADEPPDSRRACDGIVAAMERGMRKGEILSLQWKQVRWLQNEIALEWQNTKTRRVRQIPISPTFYRGSVAERWRVRRWWT